MGKATNARRTVLKVKKILLGSLLSLGVAGVIGWFSLDKETRGLLATLPTNADLLFWSQPQRDAAFRALDRLPFVAKSNRVPASGSPSPLPSLLAWREPACSYFRSL